MTSKIVVNNIEADTGISTITFTNEVTAPTFNGNIVGTAATFSGNVDIAGALTYEDVTNVDSVGIITARSGIHVTSGKVGIGTDMGGGPASYYGFGVYRASGTGYLYTETAQSGASAGLRAKAGTSDFTIFTTQGTGQLAVYDNTNSVERLRITSAGLIGIGTVSPSGPIHAHTASGTQRSYFEASASHSLLRLKSASTSYNTGVEFFSGASNIANINGLGAGGLQFEVGGAERLRIDSIGRALLGSQRTYGGGTYYDDLTINNSNTASGAAGGAGIDLVSGNASWGGYIFSDSDNHARGYIKYDHGDDEMVFGTSGSNRLRILSDGTVATGGLSATPGTVAAGSYIQAAANAGFFNNGYDGKFGTSSNHPVYFQVNGSSKASITSAGNLSITDGNLVIGTSGHGIDFSVTGDGSGTVGTNGELLDEYEEGTYTPVMVQGVTSPTYSIQAGRYTRIGNKVYVDFYIRFASGAANGSAIQIGGLPFTLSGLTYGNAGAGQLTRGGGGTSFQNLNSGDGNITFYGATPSNYFSCYIGGTAWSTVVSNVTNLFIIGSFHYHA